MDLYQLPYPPSVNNYWRYWRNRACLTAKAKRYRRDVVLAMREQKVIQLQGEIELGITLFPPDRRRRDIDNALKALLDSLAYGGLYEDDSQITRLCVEKDHCIEDGMVLVMAQER